MSFGSAIDCDVSQPEWLEFRYIKGRLRDASLEEPNQSLQAIDGFFSPLKKHTGTRVSGVAVDGLVEGT
jgi:hypothetical protein